MVTNKRRAVTVFLSILILVLIGFYASREQAETEQEKAGLLPARPTVTRAIKSAATEDNKIGKAQKLPAHTTEIDAVRKLMEEEFRAIEKQNYKVLQNAEEGESQNVLLGITLPPAETFEAVRAKFLQKHSREVVDAAMGKLGDFTSFSAGTHAAPHWKKSGMMPKSRLLRITIFKNTTLSVSFVDSSMPIEHVWQNGVEVTAGMQSYGRLTKKEAVERFWHLFSIEGVEGLKADEGSPESVREKRGE